MGSGASVPATQDDALVQGYSQKEIDEYIASLSLITIDDLFAKLDVDDDGEWRRHFCPSIGFCADWVLATRAYIRAPSLARRPHAWVL